MERRDPLKRNSAEGLKAHPTMINTFWTAKNNRTLSTRTSCTFLSEVHGLDCVSYSWKTPSPVPGSSETSERIALRLAQTGMGFAIGCKAPLFPITPTPPTLRHVCMRAIRKTTKHRPTTPTPTSVQLVTLPLALPRATQHIPPHRDCAIVTCKSGCPRPRRTMLH